MIHTDGIQTIANAPARPAPRVGDVRLSPSHARTLLYVLDDAVGPLFSSEIEAREALRREVEAVEG